MCSSLLTMLILINMMINCSRSQLEPGNQFYNPIAQSRPQFNQYPGQPYGQQLYNGHEIAAFGSLPFSVGRICDIKVENDQDFQKCRTEALVDWGSTTYTDRQIKYLCCFTWDIVDCMEDTVQYRCSRQSYDFEDYYRNYAVRKEELRNSLERYQCIDYPYHSIRCHFFWWVIAIIVIVVFTVILIVAAVCYRFCRKKYSKRTIRATDVKVNN